MQTFNYFYKILSDPAEGYERLVNKIMAEVGWLKNEAEWILARLEGIRLRVCASAHANVYKQHR